MCWPSDLDIWLSFCLTSAVSFIVSSCGGNRGASVSDANLSADVISSVPPRFSGSDDWAPVVVADVDDREPGADRLEGLVRIADFASTRNRLLLDLLEHVLEGTHDQPPSPVLRGFLKEPAKRDWYVYCRDWCRDWLTRTFRPAVTARDWCRDWCVIAVIGAVIAPKVI